MNTMTVSSHYCVEIDRVSKEDWEALLPQFRDATVNQTWSFGAGLSGENSLSHLLLKRDNQVVAAAQIRIETLPVIRAGIAYLGWGPLWRRWDKEGDPEDFQAIVKALRDEYAIRRGLRLTVLPNKWESDPDAHELGEVLTSEGFQWHECSHRTLLLDLEPSLADLRKQLHKKWRSHLNRVEKDNLVIQAGHDDAFFEKFKCIYREMVARKQYPRDIDIDTYAGIQRDLPEGQKPRVVLCQSDGELLAGLVLSTIGDTAIAMLAATSDRGTQCNASYLVEWRTIEWLKEQGYRTYDLGGADPENTPGPYQYKSRICGKKATVVRRVGEFVACDSAVSSSVVKCGYMGKRSVQWLKSKIKIPVERRHSNMLIINADDFGLSHEVNMAIVKAFAEGLCSSCTIMPNMPAFEEACELVHELGLQNHVGVHLVLTEGVPLTERIRGLRRFCNREGLFCLSRKKRVVRLSRVERQALAEETAAQIGKCRKHHLRLTHLDSHNHAHEEWGIGSLVIPLAHEERIPYVRLSRNFGPALTPAKRLYKYAFNQRLRREGLARTAYFGSPEDYRLFLRDPRNRQGPQPSWAVMAHPAFDENNRLVDSWIEKPLGKAVGTLDGYEDAVSYGGQRYRKRAACESVASSRVDTEPTSIG